MISFYERQAKSLFELSKLYEMYDDPQKTEALTRRNIQGFISWSDIHSFQSKKN